MHKIHSLGYDIIGIYIIVSGSSMKILGMIYNNKYYNYFNGEILAGRNWYKIEEK